MSDTPEDFQYLERREFHRLTRNARYPHGVLYQGEFETPWDGTAAAVRLHARALGMQGVPLLLRSFSNIVVNRGVAEPVHVAGLDEEIEKEVGPWLKTDMAICAPVIKHLVVSDAARLRRQLIPRGAMPRNKDDLAQVAEMRKSILDNTIVYSVWERDRVAQDIARLLQQAAEVWVPCRQNAEMLRAQGVERVQVIPHPYDAASSILKLTRRQWIPAKRFYSIGRWEPRKGYDKLLAAFLLAYRPGSSATLTIKYSGSGQWRDYVTPEQALEQAVRGGAVNGWTMESARRQITLIDTQLKRSMIVKLHYDNNIYVSSSHGEAFNLPAFEAKLAGNRLVHVPFGGTADFCGPDDVAVPYELEPVHSSYGWEADARWAEYAVLALAQCLSDVEVPRSFSGGSHLLQSHSLATVGALMLERVRAVVADRAIDYQPRPDDELHVMRHEALAQHGAEPGFDDGAPAPLDEHQ